MKKSPFSDRDQREVAAYDPPASPGNIAIRKMKAAAKTT